MIAPVSISWLIEALAASTVLMLVVLLLRAPVRKAFGPQIAYALWLLPVLRLLLPPLPATWQAAAVVPVQRATEQMTILFVEPVGETAAPALSLLGPAVALLWIAGAAVFLVWHTLAHRRFCRRMLDQAASTHELDGIHVIETSAASGPLAFGIWRRYVAFPRDFTERYEPEERDLALAHELGHHARGDLIANWVALVVLALHWFNPIAWHAFRAFRADQEIANDARVLAGMNPMRRHSYACAIVKAAHGGAVSAACHLHTIDDLKGRLRMLTTNKTSRARLLTGAGALALLMTAGLGLTASGTAAAAKVRRSVETATGVDLASLDQAAPAPAPVAPPAPPSGGAALPAPPAPPAMAGPGTTTVTTTVAPDGKVQRKVIRIIRRDHDGKMSTDDLAGMPDIPEVKSADCKPGADGGQMVKNFEKDGKKIIIICTNRIEKVAAEGAAMGANSKDIERNAYVHALSGLRDAKARMLTSTDMGADERKHALDGIDTAIAEIEGDLAKLK